MCGVKSKACWLLLVVFLLSSLPLYSVDVGEKLYQITESELTELETILTRQALTINQLSMRLGEQQTEITNLSETLNRQQTTIERQRTSFDEYVNAEGRSRIRLGVGAGAAGLGVGVVIGVVMMVLGG